MDELRHGSAADDPPQPSRCGADRPDDAGHGRLRDPRRHPGRATVRRPAGLRSDGEGIDRWGSAIPLGEDAGHPAQDRELARRAAGTHERDRPPECGREEDGMMRILLVEDNDINRELLRAMIETAGYEVEEAANGLEALAVLERSVPDLILTDIQMPMMSGSAFLQEVRRQPHLAKLKVLAVSAFAMRGDRERALAEGFDGYLTKPVQKTELREQIRALVGMPP